MAHLLCIFLLDFFGFSLSVRNEKSHNSLKKKKKSKEIIVKYHEISIAPTNENCTLSFFFVFFFVFLNEKLNQILCPHWNKSVTNLQLANDYMAL